MSAAFYPQVQKIYVAYYGRPADPAGLQYWAGQLAANGGNLTSIINAFGASAESTALYAGADNSAKVTAIYQQLFNRAPDAAGLAFYTAELTANRMTASSIALNVANGAQGTDATYLNNKVTVATSFTDSLTVDSAAAVAYTGTTATTAARSLITGVTTSAATTNVASTITSIKAGGGAAAGQTFTLTDDGTVTADYSNLLSGIKVIIDGDDTAVTGSVFDVKLTRSNDTFIAGAHLSTNVDAGEGIDTLDLSEYDNGGTAVDVNIESGSSSIQLTTKGFENVIASVEGGRIVGTSAMNVFTAGEGTDDFSLGGGDDIVNVDVDNLTDDDYNGGAGTDTLNISGDDTVSIDKTDENIVSIENVNITDKGNDLTVTLEDYFDGTTSSTSAVTNGIRKITMIGDKEDVLTIVEATVANLIGVRIEGAETVEVDEEVVLGTSTSFSTGTILKATGAGDGVLLNGAGTFDLSNILIDNFVDITGDSSAQTIALGSRTMSAFGDVTKIDGGAGTDIVTARGTTTLNLSLDVISGGLVAVETVDFGSADRAIVDEADFDASNVTTVVGTSGTSDLLVIDGNGGGVTVDLSSTKISGVERVALDASGATSTITIGRSTLTAGTVMAGDTGTDTLKISGNDVDISAAIFESIEVLDVDDETVSMSIATFSQFGKVDANGGTIVFKDAGTVKLASITSQTGTLGLTFGSGVDSITFGTYDDNAKKGTWSLGGGNDSLTFASNTTIDGTTVKMGDGDDLVDVGSTSNTANTDFYNIQGGAGTDTLQFTGTVNAAWLAGVGGGGTGVTQFEVLKSGNSGSAISVTLTTATDFETIDLRADVNTTGSNVVDLSAYEGSTMTVYGGAGTETIKTGNGDQTGAPVTMVVDAGGGDDEIVLTGTTFGVATITITTGEGRDDIDLSTNVADLIDSTNSTGYDNITITDFVDGLDQIDLTGETWVAQSITQGQVDAVGPASFAAARDAAFAAVDTEWSAFVYAGNTYLIYDDGTTANEFNLGEDLIVRVTGVHAFGTSGNNPTIIV